MAEMVYSDQQCPDRPPGLTHTLRGTDGGPCTTCGAPTMIRNRTEAGTFAGTVAVAVAVVHAVLPVNECSCFACRHPNGDNVGIRVLHRRRHEEFADWLGSRFDSSTFSRPSPRAIQTMRDREADAPTTQEQAPLDPPEWRSE